MKSPLFLWIQLVYPTALLSVLKIHVQFIILAFCTFTALTESKDESVMDYLFTKIFMSRILYAIMIL